MNFRNHDSGCFGDGLVACALLNKSKGQNAGWVHITIGWGAAVVMGVFAATSLGAPQADINPAVTMAKMLAGTIPCRMR